MRIVQLLIQIWYFNSVFIQALLFLDLFITTDEQNGQMGRGV